MDNFYISKLKFLTTFLLFICIGSYGQSSLKLIDHKNPIINGHQVIVKASPSSISSVKTNSTRKSILKSWGPSSTSDVLIEEDFSKITKGTLTNPDTTAIDNFYGAPGAEEIDPSYTQMPGWTGDGTHPAGGAICQIAPNAWSAAPLNTPYGDYSGDLTITCRVKALDNSSKSNILFITPCKGSIAYPTMSDLGDKDRPIQINVYPNQGWTEVTYRVTNKYAGSNGFIQFCVYGKILIDDIKVMSTPNFIAAPVILPESNFQKKGFTINWDPVRKASNYRVFLYKKEYTSNLDSVVYSSNFDTGMPTDWNPSGTLIKDGGIDNTQALSLSNGDTLTTPYNMAKLKYMKFWIKVTCPDEEKDALKNAQIILRVKDKDNWNDFGAFTASGFTTPNYIDLQEESYNSFNDTYYGVQIIIKDLPSNAHVILDNIKFTTGRPATLVPVKIDDYTQYALTSDPTYTFTNLDSLGDYYYSVKSHYLMLVSSSTFVHARGISTPELAQATEIDPRGGYTANWKETPKATQYIVKNYGIYTADKAIDNYPVLDENFDKVDASVTSATDPNAAEALGNNTAEYFDDYTSLPGWGGRGNTVTQGMIGCAASSTDWNYIQTPLLYLCNDNTYNIHVKAYGTSGDYLGMKINDIIYFQPFDENGVVDVNCALTGGTKSENILFYSYTMQAFSLDEVKITQNLKAGDHVYINLATAQTKEGTPTYHFSNLSQYNYAEYAYSVRALMDDEEGTVASNTSDFEIVNLEKGTSVTSIKNITDQNVHIIGCYTLNGVRLSHTQKGINIIKLSNGEVRKVVIK